MDPNGDGIGSNREGIGCILGPIFIFIFVFMFEFMFIFIGSHGEGIGSNREGIGSIGRCRIQYVYSFL